MTMERAPVVIVSGFMRCGMATTMAMLEAGGIPIAGGAHPPTYELPQTAHKVELFMRGMFAPYGMDIDQALAQLPPEMLALGDGYDPAWIAGCGGKAVKLVNPHLVPSIPFGPHRAIWLDRDEQERARSLAVYLGMPPIGLFCDIIANYFTTWRPAARAALEKSGATILDIQHADLTGGAERCRAAVDRIADFLDVPLDRDAMVRRSSVAIV
jgi:hypothetical protein